MNQLTKDMRAIALIFSLLITVVLKAQQHQNQILQNVESGNYKVFKVKQKSHRKYQWVPVKKSWPLQITKNAAGAISEVMVKRAGILDEKFVPDVPGYPAYFSFAAYRLSYLDGLWVYYSWNGKEEATAKYVFTKKSDVGLGVQALNSKVAAYAKAVFKKQTQARAVVKEEKLRAAEEERKLHSIENRKVKALRIKFIGNVGKVAHYAEAIAYGVEAELADGTVLSTANLGGSLPWSDFELHHQGVSNTTEEVRVDEDATSLKNDQIVVELRSKFHTHLKARRSLPTTNDIPIRVTQNGFWGYNRHKHMAVIQGKDGQHAGRGDHLTVKIKTVKHRQTGRLLNKIEIFNTTKNKLVARYKLLPTTKLSIHANGGGGMNGFEGSDRSPNGGNGGYGGAGGVITLIKDPSVKQATLELQVNGGKGGRGGAPKYASASRGQRGRAGDPGKIIRKTQKVTFKF